MRRMTPAGVAFAAFLAIMGAAPPQAARAEGQASIEPAARQLLTAALERVAGAKAFTSRADIANDVTLPSKEKVQFAGTLEIAVRRPNKLFTSSDGEQHSTRIWYDGTTLTLLRVAENVYACWPAPGRLEDLFGAMKDKLGFTPPLSPLLKEGVVAHAFDRFQTGSVVGPATIGGTPCTHLVFRGRNTDWQFWVTEGSSPLIKRVVITRKTEPGAPQYAATFLEWNFEAALPDAAFTFAPPKGTARCEFQPVKP